MSIYNRKIFQAIAVVLLALGVALPAVQADDDRDGKYVGKYGGENRGKPLQLGQTNSKFQQECSACHIAYVPGLLPAESWRRIMAGLGKHFGSNASLDAEDSKEITAFLVSNASNRWSAPTAPLQITEANWFRRKHGEREIRSSIWKNPHVKSPSNCAACHPQAERGDFSERNIRMP
ncbi:MAG: hypothetical protein A3F73_05250 [Gallionellales bacterium RIFCSPLOWO2_12_FULL_59_22]|nr:MAG: hypothetical protein A3H99_00090 [Gallionellales bacterium RIFCSPLOWO2_02_FULL_59_110]OGT05015.1 MAG: hypothetical protein A2Z65_08290 [Gallionellales bacterium RIFCSPLOWO2_02_58_13]OGT12554.1 MAG: hypothetical protein A3F73_05250 [Gallionellales bacterium RIFCSPLOWO2_12_FULL_59_22]